MEHQRIHGTCVALNGRSVLLIGPPGSGKSSVALRLMALGATLVADDSVDLNRNKDDILTTPPDSIKGMIEARNLGILYVEHCNSAKLHLVIDMDKTEVRRMPEEKTMRLLDMDIPLVFGGNNLHLADAVFCMLKAIALE